MKLEDFKNQAKDIEVEKKNINQLKMEIKSNFEEIFALVEKLGNKKEQKNKEIRGNLKQEIIDFFNDSELVLSHPNENSILVTFKDSTIEIILGENDDGFVSCFVNIKPQGIYNTMEVEPDLANKMLFHWERGIYLSGENLYKGNYKEQIDRCNDIKELTEVNNNLLANIKKFKYSTTQVDNMEYLYKVHSGTRTFESFKDFFENYIE